MSKIITNYDTQAILAAIVESSDDAIIGKDPDGVILSWNQSAEQMYGYHQDEVVGKNISILAPPDHLDEIPHILETIRRGDYVHHFETERMTKDGRRIHVSLTVSPIRDKAGNIVGASTIARDITDHKRTEEEIRRLNAELEQRIAERTSQLHEAEVTEMRVRSVLEMAPDGIIIVDSRGFITFANSQAGKLFAYEPDDLLGKSVETLIPERYHDVHIEHRTGYAAAPRTRPMGIGLELYGLRKDGTEFPVEIALSPMWTDGKLTVTAIIRDTTERKLAEEEIRILNAELERRVIARTAQLEAANKELEAFSYSVSHDLSGPLRLIDGFSRDLAKSYQDKLDERGRKDITWIRESVGKMAHLIDDLLRLSRIGRADLHFQDVDLSAIVQSIANDLQRQNPERQVTFAIQPGIIACADASLIRIALDNLIGNAWKFTSKTPDACIDFGASDEVDEWVYFVKDNGAGFDMTYADRLFTPFERLHTEAEFPGMGIGLAIVRRIINRHSGRVWAEGEVRNGASIYFTLDPEGDQL